MNKIDFSYTKINDGFWKQKQDMVKNTTLYSVYDRFVETHRFDALSCTWKEGDPDMPHIFWDSDVAKWIEGASYILQEERVERLEAIIDDAVDKIVQNSDKNGYFNSHFLVTEQGKCFTDRSQHELYCAGHLIEGAIAYKNATGKDKFLKTMCKYADYIERAFKTEKNANFTTPGHPELELALVKLYEATNEKRYLELSKFFIDEHGRDTISEKNDSNYANFNPLYNQDELPLRERTTAEGHCVRALYLMCGAADIARKYNDKELLDSCKRFFDDIAMHKMYITGGVGSSHLGEAFTVPYHLPNRTAYNETCAAIALALFANRMLSAEVNSKYADAAERAIYNGFLSGVSMDGKSFFYENPLDVDPYFNNINNSTNSKEHFPITQRVEVFYCSCCPPNVVRFIPSIADFLYTYDDEAIYVHQYMYSETSLGDIKLSQNTAYPADGKISFKCTASQRKIALRIPAWCKSFSLNKGYEMKNGYAYIENDGDEIELIFDMPVTFVKANKRVHENAGRVAVMRGPVVYCAEGIDNFNDLHSVKIDTDSTPLTEDGEFILPSITLDAVVQKEDDSLYSTIGDDYESCKLKLIPYYAFANRKETEMLVWFLRK